VLFDTPVPKVDGVKFAVTFAGNPDAERLTEPVNPPKRANVNATVAAAPCVVVAVAAPAVNVTPDAFTMTCMVVVRAVTPDPLARMVTVDVPDTAVDPAVSVRELVATPDASVAGANVAVTPVGSPSAASVTSPMKLPPRVTLTVASPGAPGVVVTAPGAMTTAMAPDSVELSLQAAIAASARTAVKRPAFRRMFPTPKFENIERVGADRDFVGGD